MSNEGLLARDFSSRFPIQSRPNLLNHHSNSLPSTPYQHPRQLPLASRTSSPEHALGAGSPRSTHSESNKTPYTRGKIPFRAGCKYETGMAFSRRRMPYSIGDELLERPKHAPKKCLDRLEDRKLNGDMRELYGRLLPTPESEARRKRFVGKLQTILNDRWPGYDISVHVFGSSGNLLCTSDSDVDICITTPMKELERVCLLAEALAEHGMEQVVCVSHAKVPIVKIWDPELQLACDMNVNNTLALENTRMIKTYVEIDERVRPLAMIIKHWTKMRVLNDAALGGTLSSYTWICMILNFLQTRKPPILPCLHRRPHQQRRPSEFADNLESLRGFGVRNTDSVGQLLFQFFRYYGYEIDYEKSIVSVREGQLISKESKRWHLMPNNRLCVEEPFNTERNLGNTADDTAFRGLHLELRRAFDLISEAKLHLCLQQYIFPATEERFTWARPVPQTRPVLTRSASQSRPSIRGNKSNRGSTRVNGQSRNGPTGRRASSAAATGNMNAQANGLPRISAQQAQQQIHDQLYNRYQFLQLQEQQLRMQLFQQARAQAHMQSQAQTPNSAHHQTLQEVLGQSALTSPGPLSAPLQQGTLIYPLQYGSMGSPMNGLQHEGVHTNPPSPSITPILPELRRSLHRLTTTRSDHSSGVRSHSQPAPAVSQGSTGYNTPQDPRFGDMSQMSSVTRTARPNAREDGKHLRMKLLAEGPRYDPTLTNTSVFEQVPREYVGYYLHEALPIPVNHNESTLAPMSSHDMSVAYNGAGNLATSSHAGGASGSPSPSRSLLARDRSCTALSAASAPSNTLSTEGSQATTPKHRSSGPIIVKSSDDVYGPGYSVPTYSAATARTPKGTIAVPDEPFQGPSKTTEATANLEPNSGENVHENRKECSQHLSSSTIPRLESQDKKHIVPCQTFKESSAVHNLHLSRDKGFFEGDLNHLEARSKDIVPLPTFGFAETAKETMQENVPTVTHEHSIDFRANQPNHRHEKAFIPAPLLSPVREVRTPSPTASRSKLDQATHRKNPSDGARSHLSTNSVGSIEGRLKDREDLSEKLKGASPIIADGSTNSPVRENSGWQHTTKKNKKKSKVNASQAAGLQCGSRSALGEALPLNVSERKGG